LSPITTGTRAKKQNKYTGFSGFPKADTRPEPLPAKPFLYFFHNSGKKSGKPNRFFSQNKKRGLHKQTPFNKTAFFT